MEKIIIVVFFSIFCHGIVNAQDIKSCTSGFSFGLFGVMHNWASTSNFIGQLDDSEPNGVGVGGQVAYGLNERFTILLDYSQSGFRMKNKDWENYSHQLFHLGFRVNFGATLKTLRPFLQGGIGQHTMKIAPIVFLDDIFEETYSLKMTGFGADLGVGTQVFILPNLAGVVSSFGRFGGFGNIDLNGNDFDPGSKTDFRFLSIQIGLNYYFE